MAKHIGKRVDAVFRAQRPKLAVTAFAKEIGRSRKNVYDLFASPTIDTGLLRNISKVLGHDFFQYLSPKPVTATVGRAAYPHAKDPPPAPPPLQIMVTIDPADPDAQRKITEILRIMNGG